VTMAGKSVHTDAARRLARRLDDDGLLPQVVRYASSCSGGDFFAPAVKELRPNDTFQYLHAAEKDEGARSVLRDAWGLSEDDIYRDAGGADAASAPTVDLYVTSPECVKMTKHVLERSAELLADGAIDAVLCMPFILAQRATVVVVENVSEGDAVDCLTTLLRHCFPEYEWRGQELDACREGGALVARARFYWVGVLRTNQAHSAATSTADCTDATEPRVQAVVTLPRGARWTAEEDEVLLAGYGVMGGCWRAMVEQLPGRSANAAQLRWRKLGCYSHLHDQG